jgi:hypothetical protein
LLLLSSATAERRRFALTLSAAHCANGRQSNIRVPEAPRRRRRNREEGENPRCPQLYVVMKAGTCATAPGAGRPGK